MDFFSRFPSSGYGILLVDKKSEGNFFAVFLYACAPLPMESGYPASPRSVVSLEPAITLVLRWSRNSKIKLAIIQSVVIAVIAFLFIALFQSKNLAMHQNGILSLSSNCIKTVHACDPHGAPFPLDKPFVMRRVNFRKLALGQRDKAIRFVRASFLFKQVHEAPFQRCFSSP